MLFLRFLHFYQGGNYLENVVRHFGCIIKNLSESSLTRDNYAVINDITRKNSFMHDKRYSRLSYIEANEKCINDIENRINFQLENYITFYKKAISTDSNEVLKKYISLCKNNVIEKKKENFNFENTLSKIQFEALASGRKTHSKCYEGAKKAWIECQDIFKEIDNFTIETVLKNVRRPDVLVKWQSINGKSSIEVTRDFIRQYIEENCSLPYHTDEWCEKQIIKALENFDLNMEFFEMLDNEKFNNEILSFLNQHKEFVEVKDLNDYSRISGIYIMVLDKYKQIYIGMTEKGLKERIKEHWARKMPLDRLLFGGVYDSKISIDSFRYLDTTRIFVYPCKEKKKLLLNELKFTDTVFSQEFLCNRCSGGGETWLEAVALRKKRDL